MRLSPLGTAATLWPTVPAPDHRWLNDDDYRWWPWSNRWNANSQGTQSIRRKPAPVPLCPPQIPHDLIWARTWAATVGNRRLNAWAMARPRGLLNAGRFGFHKLGQDSRLSARDSKGDRYRYTNLLGSTVASGRTANVCLVGDAVYIKCVPGNISPGLKQLGWEANTYLEIIRKFRMNSALYPFPYCQHRVVLQHSDNFTYCHAFC
jgi:hypothetical protein